MNEDKRKVLSLFAPLFGGIALAADVDFNTVREAIEDFFDMPDEAWDAMVHEFEEVRQHQRNQLLKFALPNPEPRE